MRVRRREDAGLTLVEMMVALMLLGIVGSMTATIMIAVQKTFRSDDDEARGLADVRKAVERLNRDIRDARGITISADPAVSASASQLTVWIDFNSDYVHQTSEDVTWKLVSAAGGHYNLVRGAGGSVVTVVEARTLVSNLAFSYCKADATCVTAPTSPTGIELVKTDMTYDSLVATAAGARHVVVEGRMRNVA
jgi:prepilin-type N-terminal cleavage/methylation domain-containing protein